MAKERVVIVGGGLTAARAAESVRAHGFDGDVVVVAEERRLPYERPPLSKGYLTGSEGLDATVPIDADAYRDRGIEVREGVRATSLDFDARRVTVEAADGAGAPEKLAYDRLLLATGASARRFDGPGADLGGVHTLRTVDDAEALRAALAPGGRRVVIVGAGWIGLEAAAAARGYGNDVVVLGRGDVPLASAIGAELGGVFARLHREQGVDLRMGAAVAGLRGGPGGAVEAVALESGDEVPADVVLFGIGATPNTALAASAGLTVDDGIATDAGFATDADGVFAAGDVASIFTPTLGRRLRVEHWANADAGGRAVGRALAGESVEYDEIPYFYTDQYDLGMEYSGYGALAADADLVVRGDLDAREFVAFHVLGDRVVAGMNVNVWDVNADVQRLIRSRIAVDRARLADPDVPLAELAEGAA